MPVSGSLGYRSGFLNLPPRVLLRARDNVQDRLSYPKIRRSGGKDFSHEVGFGSLWFDDTMTPVFGAMGGPLTTTVLYPQLLPIYHPLLQNTIATPNVLGSITVDRNIVEDAWEDEFVYGQYGEKEVPVSTYRHGISPFDESRVYLDTTDFYDTGTLGSTIPTENGFATRLADKIQIVIDIEPVGSTTVAFSTGTVPGPAVGGYDAGVNTGIAYFNWERKMWEVIGDLSTGSNVDIINFDQDIRDNAYLAFAPNGLNSSDVNFSDLNYYTGLPVNNYGFPFNTKYDATGSQVYSMRDKISAPFLVEKITIEFSASFGPEYIYNKYYGPCVKQFFLMNQFQNSYKGGTLLNPPLTMNNYYSGAWQPGAGAYDYVGEVAQPITASQGKIRDFIGAGEISMLSDDRGLDQSGIDGVQPQYYRDLNISRTDSPSINPDFPKYNAITGSYILEFEPRTYPIVPAAGSVAIAYGGPGGRDTKFRTLGGGNESAWASSTLVGSFFSGRQFTDSPSGQSFVGGVPGTLPSASYGPPYNTRAAIRPIGSNTVYDVTQAPTTYVSTLRKPSPYILFPHSTIVLGYSNPPNFRSQGFQQYGDEVAFAGEELVKRANTILSPGVGKLTLFGSYLRDGKAQTDVFNQPLTSDAIHEVIHEIIHDQFQVEPTNVYSGSYIDDIWQGSLFSRTSRYVAGRPTEGTQGTTGSLLRAIKMATEDERYFDSVMPDTKMYFIDSTAAVSGVFFKPTAYKRLPATAIFLSGALDFSPAHSGSIFIKESLAFPYASDPPRVVSDITPVVLHTSGNLGIGGDPGEQDNTLYTVSGQTALDILYRTRYSNMSASLRYITRGAGQNDQGLPVASVNDSRTGQGGQATGFRYGIVNSRPLYSEAVFRYDKFGQMRDMLEQRHDTRFFDGSVKGSTQVLEPPIEIVFVDGNGNIVRPIRTTSQNLSKFATSSIPYIDGEFTDRPAPLKQRINIIEIDEIVG